MRTFQLNLFMMLLEDSFRAKVKSTLRHFITLCGKTPDLMELNSSKEMKVFKIINSSVNDLHATIFIY